MAKHQIIKDVGAALGLTLQPNETTVIGMKNGYPVQVLTGIKGSSQVLSGVIRYDNPAMDSLIKESLPEMPELKRAQIKKKNIEVGDGVLSFNMIKGLTGFPKPEAFAAKIEIILKALKTMVSAPGLKCRVCGLTEMNQPILVNSLIDRICPGCIEKLKVEAVALQASYESLPMNMPLAFVVALVLAAIGAAVYGGIIIASGKMYWIIAIGIGAIIGMGTAKAAGRVGPKIQILSAAFTVASVLLGLVFVAGYNVHEYLTKQGQTVNWVEFIKNIPMILVSMKGDTLFSLCGGLIGAYYATRHTKKPEMALKVEK